jgi:signal peptidase I
MNWKKIAKKTWWFIWESDSIWSWIVNIILAFIIIKLLVYPGLGFVMQTSHPVVAVVSGSMEHKTVHPCALMSGAGCVKRDTSFYEICGKVFSEKQKVDLDFFWETCGPWYENNTDIIKEDFANFKLKNGFNTGDIMVLRGTKPENIKVGDTIVYLSRTASYPIIHRVVEINKGQSYSFTTKGDHNSGQDAPVNENQLIGKAILRIPLLGWIKIGFVKLLNFFGVL